VTRKQDTTMNETGCRMDTKPVVKGKVPAKVKKPATGHSAKGKKIVLPDNDWTDAVREALEGLNEQRTVFVMEYVKDFDRVRAYRVAYGGHLRREIAAVNAHRLLTNANVRRAVRIITDSIFREYRCDPAFILRQMAILAHVNLYDFIEIQDDGTANPDLGLASKDMLAGIEEYHTEEVSEPTGVKGEAPRNVRRTRIKLVSKRAVLMDLAKLQKMFSDNFSPRAETAQIMLELRAGDIDMLEAAFRFTELGLPLPEVIKIQLQKAREDAGEGINNEQISDEELDRRYQEAMARQQRQREEFLPERQAEVVKIKESLKGMSSFDPHNG
jgi:hypothetical protein